MDDVAGVACAAVGRVHERDFVTKTVFIFVTKAGALNHPKKEVTKTGQNNLIASKKVEFRATRGTKFEHFIMLYT